MSKATFLSTDRQGTEIMGNPFQAVSTRDPNLVSRQISLLSVCCSHTGSWGKGLKHATKCNLPSICNNLKVLKRKRSHLLLTLSLKATYGRNRILPCAGIVMAAPDMKFRPGRSFDVYNLNVPNLSHFTTFPLETESTMASRTVSMTSLEREIVRPCFFATTRARSGLVVHPSSLTPFSTSGTEEKERHNREKNTGPV